MDEEPKRRNKLKYVNKVQGPTLKSIMDKVRSNQENITELDFSLLAKHFAIFVALANVFLGIGDRAIRQWVQSLGLESSVQHLTIELAEFFFNVTFVRTEINHSEHFPHYCTCRNTRGVAGVCWNVKVE